jgi:hypothetical protein
VLLPLGGARSHQQLEATSCRAMGRGSFVRTALEAEGGQPGEGEICAGWASGGWWVRHGACCSG